MTKQEGFTETFILRSHNVVIKASGKKLAKKL